MKRTFKPFLIVTSIVAAVTIIYSCSKTDKQTEFQASPTTANSSPYQVSGLTNNSSAQALVNAWLTKSRLPVIQEGSTLKESTTETSIRFNYSNLFLAQEKGFGDSVIVANQIGYNKDNAVNYGISFYLNKGKIAKVMIIRLEKTSENIRRISYLTTGMKVIKSVEINIHDKSVTCSSQNYRKVSSVYGLPTLMESSVEDTGDCTAHCISDAYSNHGWASVAAWVVSAFFPETVAAIALECALHCGTGK